ncbi:MAG: hypothetical protein ACFFBZ_08780 [Promethearchaeota archaeon]
MVQFYTKFLHEDKFAAKEKEKATSKRSIEYEYIWERQPSRKDISMKHSLTKFIFLISIGFLFMLETYLLSKNVYLAMGLTVILELGFILVFYDTFFLWRGKGSFRPFRDLIFWQIENDKSTLYYTNYKDLLTVGIKIFSVEVLAENVHSVILNFLNAFSGIEEYIPFTYQVVHTKKESGAFKTYIFFIVFSSTQGKVTNHRIGSLSNQLFHYGVKFKSLFSASFHHFLVTPLSGNALIGAIRSSLFQEDFNEIPIKEIGIHRFNKKASFIKSVFIIFLLVIFNVYFSFLSFPLLFTILFNVLLIPAILIIWWKTILFQLFSVKFFESQSIFAFDPFYNVAFYLSPRIPDIIFAHVDHKELIGMKLYNVFEVIKPPLCSFRHFFSGVNNHQIPFTYTAISHPLSFAELDKEYAKKLREKVANFIRTRLLTDADRYTWMNRRGGIWESIFLLSTTFRISTEHVSVESTSVIIEELYKAGVQLIETFGNSFRNFRIKRLYKQWIESGFECELVKNNHIYANGSHLHHIVYQGTALLNIVSIPDELKKGVTTKMAAEFNTPLHLDNFIEIGHAFNTETLTPEAPAGFLLDQLHSVLITNGTIIDRELLNMKVAVELIKKGISCLIFDFTGRWSKLLTHFENTKFQDQILHFKLGKAFTLDPFSSEIPYEADNIKYLEYMFDAYAMSFRKDPRFMQTFKNNVRQYGANLNVAKIAIKHAPDYEKNATFEELLSTLTDISQEDLAFLQTTDAEIVKVYEFITSPHTVIVDISISEDYRTLCYFMFLILSKLIRYCKSTSQFTSKFIFFPHIDLLFDGSYLDRVANYGMIDKFFVPLQENEFGIICSANEIRYLHPNVFKFLNNIATFRTTDARDIATFSNLLNLNELHGTGYYSAKRNENYQIQFLRNMRHDQILLKRTDTEQTFPVNLQVETVKNAKCMEYHEIVNYMNTQGYDLQFSEKRILSLAQVGKFERDLEEYIEYKDELLQFFDKIKTVQDVAGLYETKVKMYLLEYLNPKLSKHYSHDHKKIVKIRDTIYEILREHEYLIEHHPRTAGGGQSTRTCLIVGPAYEQVIKEDFNTKKNIPPHITVEVITQQTPGVTRFLQPILSSQTEQQLKDILAHNFDGKMVRALFKIEYRIQNKEYPASLKMLHKFVPSYIKKCCTQYYHSEEVITKNQIIEFIKLLSDLQGFPFRNNELKNLFERCEQIEVGTENIEQLSHEIYNLVFKWYIKLKKFLNR